MLWFVVNLCSSCYLLNTVLFFDQRMALSSNGATDDSFLELGPLSEMARLRYAAQVLSKLSGKSVSQAALPPELVIFLDEGAAGIPKHIFETLRECMRKDALGEDGPAIRVSDNGRIEVSSQMQTLTNFLKIFFVVGTGLFYLCFSRHSL